MGNIFQSWWVMGFVFLRFKDWVKQDYKSSFSACNFATSDRTQYLLKLQLKHFAFQTPLQVKSGGKSIRNQWRERETREQENLTYSYLVQSSFPDIFPWS